MFSPAEFARRRDLLREEMRRAGAELFLADAAELIGWLTGYTVSETMYRAALLPLKTQPWLVLRALDAEPARLTAHSCEVRGYPDWDNPYREVAKSVAEAGFTESTIAVDDRSYGWTAETAARLATGLPRARFVPLTGISDRIRAVKSPEEIAVLARAAAVADRMIEVIRTEAAPGMTPRGASALGLATMLAEGADPGDAGPILAARGHSEFLHGLPGSEGLEPGDILHAEVVPRMNGYSARLMRPIAIGEASPEIAIVAERLIALQDRQVAAMRPGAVAAEVDAVLRNAVLAENLRDTYENVTGYQLGLYARTPRTSDFSLCFHPRATWQLTEGQVFHMYVSAGGVAFSETVAVTPGGARRLTLSPRCLMTA